jgi:hypothetical protein
LTEYCLGYSWPLVFPYKFNSRFFNLFDECHWNFDGNILVFICSFKVEFAKVKPAKQIVLTPAEGLL